MNFGEGIVYNIIVNDKINLFIIVIIGLNYAIIQSQNCH